MYEYSTQHGYTRHAEAWALLYNSHSVPEITRPYESAVLLVECDRIENAQLGAPVARAEHEERRLPVPGDATRIVPGGHERLYFALVLRSHAEHRARATRVHPLVKVACTKQT